MDYFQLALVLLFLLAIVDLSVGVSNDAVNFLNSAIGSRVTSRRIIIAIAGLGVLTGSLLSSGIMEVARSGIFNPGMFTFADVMIIFLAVMLADVLLLDLFNTLALPTSTTVSIVFELLGAAVAVGFIAMLGGNGANLIDYVNAERALLIIGGIGLSVVIAFVVGTVVQFFSRILFTFQEKNQTDAIRIGWSAIAFTVISYFLIIKGLKGAVFVTDRAYAFIAENAVTVTLASLAVWTLVMTVLNRFKVDLLAAVVLGGTFSLALAFASNDLVNFIGVPLAGLSSWQAWSGSGLAPDAMTMQALTEPVRGNTLILLAAGLIMVVTLWLSSKARSVTQTEVNLSRQGDGVERFEPGPLSRGIVRSVIATSEAAMQAIPQQWRTRLGERFAREESKRFDFDRPAFDTLRASVNLTVASILIVFATSLKLPLSTTFVSFMVAMGTSLADRAWGRDAAVYRIAGVFSVIGGWFLTAVAAFSIAALFATLIRFGGGIAVIVLVAIATFALFRTHRYHQRQTRMAQMMAQASPDTMDQDGLTLRDQFNALLERNGELLDRTLAALLDRSRKRAKRLKKALKEDAALTRDTENRFVRRLNRMRPKIEPWLLSQLDVLAIERDMLQSATTLIELTREHVLNEHHPPSPRVAESLSNLRALFRTAFGDLTAATRGEGRSTVLREIDAEIDRLTERVLEDLYDGTNSPRNTSIMLGIALEMRDLYRELKRTAAS